MNAPKAPKAPKAPRRDARPKPRATTAEPPQGEKTATREGESSHAAPVTTSPVKSTRAEGEGSPASAQPSTPAAPRILRLTVAPADDLDALLAAVGEQCERNRNGDLAIALAAATIARRDDLPDALAWLLVYLRRDLRVAVQGYRSAVHEFARARRNDDAATIAHRADDLRRDRAELARVGALAGRIAAAVLACRGDGCS